FSSSESVVVCLLLQDEGVHDLQEWDEIGVHSEPEHLVLVQTLIVGGVVVDPGLIFRCKLFQGGTYLVLGLSGLTSFGTRLLGGDAVDVGGFRWDVRTRVEEPCGGDLAAVAGVDPPQGRGDDPVGGHVQAGCLDVECSKRASVPGGAHGAPSSGPDLIGCPRLPAPYREGRSLSGLPWRSRGKVGTSEGSWASFLLERCGRLGAVRPQDRRPHRPVIPVLARTSSGVPYVPCPR